MPLCWRNKLSNLLQTLAFCLALSAMQYSLAPQWRYEIPLVYSVCIGCSIWALVDFGRHLFASSAHTGWPQGLWGFGLPMVGIAGGYVLGTTLGDWWFGWSSWSGAARGHLPASLAISLIAGSGATYYFYSKSKSLYLERHAAQAKQQASEAQLKLLQTQLEPHMLFNTLANLRALIGTDPTRAQNMLDRLVSYLRATLDASRANTHTLQAEFDRLQDYLDLMRVRMGERLHYTLDLPAALATHPVPPLLLQALVENSIQHGLEPKVDGGSITISAAKVDGQLRLQVQDTGVGCSTDLNEPKHSGSGFGVAQVRQRLHTSYGAKAAITFIVNKPYGISAILHLPLEK